MQNNCYIYKKIETMIDTRDLIEERNELKQQVLDSFLEEFPQYEDMTEEFEDILFEEEEIQSWKQDWEEELEKIQEINDLEDEVCNGELDSGTTLILESEFTDYCEDLIKDIGDIPRDLPSFIDNNINWNGIAEDLKIDYTEVEFRGELYLFR